MMHFDSLASSVSGVVLWCVSVVLVMAPVIVVAQEHGHTHGHGHGHGEADREGGLERWLPRLEAEDRGEWQRPAQVVELLELAPGMRVADIGAGTGYFLGYLSSAVGPEGEVLGLDVDRELVQYMIQRAAGEGWSNVHPRLVATDDPGLEPGTVDRVLIVNTWHHIAEREAYGRRLATGLRPGGAVYVVDYTKEAPHGPPPEERLTAEEVMDELRAAGFEARSVAEDLPLQYVVVARLPE